MRSRWRCLLVLLCACKAEIGGGQQNPDGSSPGIDSSIDAAPDAVGTFGPWSAPALVPGPNSINAEDDGTLSNSKLEMIFARLDPAVDAGARKHLYYMKRSTTTLMDWSTPVRLSWDIDGFTHQTPRFSADDKTLFFGSDRTGTLGGSDIWQVTRTTVGVNANWNAPTLTPGVNSASGEKWCMPCNGSRYVVTSSRAPGTGSDDLWEGVGTGAPTRINELSMDGYAENGVMLSKDCLTIYFASNRSGTTKLYKSTRASVTGAWNAPSTFDDFLTTGGNQSDPFISDDQKTFVFASDVSGNLDMYITNR
jgi:hypothetical protein